MGDAAQEKLVGESRRGSAMAFTALIGSYERIALSVAYSVTGDSGIAGDVVQDAFLRAWQRIGDLKESEKFGPWLCGIVRNLSIDVARARAVRYAKSSHELDASGAVDPRDDPLDQMGREEDRQQVTEAIQSLDEMSRSVVVLRYYENLSSKQIGELLGLAPTAVDMRLMRARRQLRSHLEVSAGIGALA